MSQHKISKLSGEDHLQTWIESLVPASELADLRSTIRKAPGRISKAYKEMLSGYKVKDPKSLISVTRLVSHNEDPPLVMACQVPFSCICLHHFLPFFGTIDFGYKPMKKIIGIGKLNRLIDFRCNRFNIQEDIALELCTIAMDLFEAKGAFVRVTARHMCACYRGSKKYNVTNVVCSKLGEIDMQEVNIALSGSL